MRCSVVFWRNVEASSFCFKLLPFVVNKDVYKHFVVFFHNQHRRLLPAMCHNLRVDGRRPPATLLTTPGMLQR